LVEEEEVEPIRTTLDFEVEEGFEFCEKELEKEEVEEHQDFQEYVREVLGTERWRGKRVLASVLERLAVTALGEVLEYGYHLSPQNVGRRGKRDVLMRRFKWTIIFHIFCCFLMFWLASIQTVILLCCYLFI
jgi:hypothetical protein